MEEETRLLYLCRLDINKILVEGFHVAARLLSIIQDSNLLKRNLCRIRDAYIVLAL